MRIIGDAPLVANLGSMLPSTLDGVIVQMEMTDEVGMRSRCAGFDRVLEIAPSGEPIVMLGWQSTLVYANDMRYHACLGYPNVHFARLPLSINEIVEAVLAKATRLADPLAIRLLAVNADEETMGVLQHDLRYAETDEERRIVWLEKARAILGNRDFTELAKEVSTWSKNSHLTELAGESFPDVCFDIEGTIFGADGVPNSVVIEAIRREAQDNPVTIWTGGRVSEYQPRIRELEIAAKVVSKHTLHGASVAKAYDDLPRSKFDTLYGINVAEYIEVS